MKITAVTTAVVHANFDYTFVRVHTDEDVHGTGECFMAPGITSMLRDLGELLIGLDPRNPNPCRQRLLTALSATGGAGTAGIGYNAISGIETALWDLLGKALDQPVSRLLGGAFRDSVEVYADLHAGGKLESLDRVMRYRTPFWLSADGQTAVEGFYWETNEADALSVERMIARARDGIDAGFRRIKFDLDVFATVREAGDRSARRQEIDSIRATVAQLRQELGEDVDIALDCHWRFDVPTAIEVAHAIAPARPLWLEDPVPPDPSALAAVSRNSPVPIATGENTYLVEGFEKLIRSDSAHVLTPDVQKAGGLLEAVRIGELAARHFRSLAPHCIASPLGFLASVHVCAACPNVSCLEFHGGDVPFWNELVTTNEPIIAAGRARVPSGPGIGAELDLEVVERYAAPGEPVFEAAPAR